MSFLRTRCYCATIGAARCPANPAPIRNGLLACLQAHEKETMNERTRHLTGVYALRSVIVLMLGLAGSSTTAWAQELRYGGDSYTRLNLSAVTNDKDSGAVEIANRGFKGAQTAKRLSVTVLPFIGDFRTGNTVLAESCDDGELELCAAAAVPTVSAVRQS